MSVVELIAKLADMPQEAQVFIHDADTDWSLPLNAADAVRLGKDEFGDGIDGAVMLRATY